MQLKPIDSLTPASYNPRKVDPERLALVELSLRKLGWLLPVYATQTGELLSGHQRTFVARNIGYTEAPTEVLPAMNDRTRKAVNILFNRSTNDMDVDTIPANLKAQILAAKPHEVAARLSDRLNHFPCLAARLMALSPLLKANAGRWITYARTVAASLAQYKIIMPLVVRRSDLRVLNGIGRLQYAAERSIAALPVVLLDDAEAEFADMALNLLSMDFAVEDKYADLLRFNSFRRLIRSRSNLGRGFVFAIIGNEKATTFDLDNPAHLAAWRKKYGTSIVDFGAGHLQETAMLRAKGISVTPFEPYRVGPKEEIDKAESVRLTRQFLADVASGQRWSSVFIASVLNSVPFEQDRKHIVKIASALCGPATTVYAVASSDRQRGWQNINKKFVNERTSQTGLVILNYEDNITLGDLGGAPKVQKYHSSEMFYRLFKSAFETVQAGYDTGVNVFAIARKPLPLAGLREALEFEFDLPYPDGSRMGLVDEAIAAFEKRHNTTL